MERFKETARGWSLAELVQALVFIVMELQYRLIGGQNQGDAEQGHVPARPMPAQPPACRGRCIICGAGCIRMNPGHRHCKCQQCLHLR